MLSKDNIEVFIFVSVIPWLTDKEVLLSIQLVYLGTFHAQCDF